MRRSLLVAALRFASIGSCSLRSTIGASRTRAAHCAAHFGTRRPRRRRRTGRCRGLRTHRPRPAARCGCPARRSAAVHHQDGVGVADRRQSVRDDEAGTTRAQRRHRPLDEHLGASVDRARRLVEDEDRRVGEERPGDREQLLLAGADRRRPRRRRRCRSRGGASARTGRRTRRAASTICSSVAFGLP